MTKEQLEINRLNYALGLALGALETINVSPYDFNKDGLLLVIKKLRAFTEPIIYIPNNGGNDEL